MTKQEWYAKHNCQHAHCPDECEHPQPFLDGDEMLCGRCWHLFGERSLMIPCTPEVCE